MGVQLTVVRPAAIFVNYVYAIRNYTLINQLRIPLNPSFTRGAVISALAFHLKRSDAPALEVRSSLNYGQRR